MVITATLAHRQLYRYRFHRAKADLMIKEEYQHRKFVPVKEFLEMVPVECPHQYFQESLRASEAPPCFFQNPDDCPRQTKLCHQTGHFCFCSQSKKENQDTKLLKIYVVQ